MVKLNQILRWLKKPKLLRLVCLASSVVGLLCYALSSSFNHLLGNWSWWKMLLYIVFSFIICFSVLFAPARSRSTSLRLESHVSFLVLIITSVYSFLFDNFVKGKPDAYSLVSCAAFATMSLGLSNLTQFGFQIDLLYFFCGGLLVQLMKIKMWLVIVGGGFSYSLLQLCDYPRHRQGENLPLQLQNLVNIQVDPRSISSSSHEEANDDVDSTLGTSPEDGDLRFQDHMHTQSNSPSQDGIQQKLMNCIKELEKENEKLVPFFCRHVEKYLKAVFDSTEKPYADVNLVLDALPSEIMRRLKEIVKMMVDAGFVEECSDIYSTWRREFVEQCLRDLRFQYQMLSDEDLKLWSKTCKAAWKIFFPNERRLCDYLFSGLSVAADVSLEKVCMRQTFVLMFKDGIQQQFMNCIKELEKENKKLVPFVSRHVDIYLKAVFDSEEEPHADPPKIMRPIMEIMGRLKEIAKLMKGADFVEECCDIYSTFRTEFLEQCLQELEVEFQMLNHGEVLEWSKASKVAWKMFFHNEATLCNYLFSDLSVGACVSFEKVCKRVLEFIHITITTKNYSRNLMFNIVPKMLESLEELEMNIIPHNSYFLFLPDLEDTGYLLLMVKRFWDIIYPDNVQAPVTRKEIEDITAESMNYIYGSCVHWTMERDGQSDRVGNSSFWVVIGRMVDLLESELEAISKDFYADNKDHYRFMVSCLLYISGRTHDFKMDNEWFQQRRAKVTRYEELYTECVRNEEILENRKRRLLSYSSLLYWEETEDKKTV